MATAFSTDLSTFVPERPVYIVGENSDGSLAYMTNQISDFNITVNSTEDVKEDANGNTIFSISRAKTCEVSFSTPLMTLEIIASMNGSEKQVGASDNLLSVPKFETLKLTATANKVVVNSDTTTIYLAHNVKNSGTTGTPVYKVSAAFLTKDGSTRKKLERGTTTPAAGEFVFARVQVLQLQQIWIASQFLMQTTMKAQTFSLHMSMKQQQQFRLSTLLMTSLLQLRQRLWFVVMTFVTRQTLYTLTLSSLQQSSRQTILSVWLLTRTLTVILLVHMTTVQMSVSFTEWLLQVNNRRLLWLISLNA